MPSDDKLVRRSFRPLYADRRRFLSRRLRERAEALPGLVVLRKRLLSSDGLWRQHSWALDPDRIIETTEPRIAYFGIVLAAADAGRFARSNG